MTKNQIFNLLFNGGNYSKQFLIELVHPAAGMLRFVNNNEDVVFKGNTYKKSNFDYTPPDRKGEGAALEISTTDNGELFAWVENSDQRYTMSVTGILNGGEVQEISSYKHFYGSVSMGEDGKISFSLENDGRLEMVFTVYKYDTELNRGNA